MTGLRLCASLLSVGRILGVGLESSVSEVDQIFGKGFIEEIVDEGVQVRRDYGWMEISLVESGGLRLSGLTLELHRLPEDVDVVHELREHLGVHFQKYTPWSDLRDAFLAAGGASTLQCTRQGDFQEYRNLDVKVSVFVVDDDSERDEWPGHGDVWSISLG